MKKEGYREQTIERAVRLLKGLSKRTSLADPEEVKATLASLEWALGTKEVASNILANYYKFQGLPFSKPFYNGVEKVPFLPSEEEVSQLITRLFQTSGLFPPVPKGDWS